MADHYRVRDRALAFRAGTITVTGGSSLNHRPGHDGAVVGTVAVGSSLAIPVSADVWSSGAFTEFDFADSPVVVDRWALRQGYTLALLGNSIESQHRSETTAASSTYDSGGYVHLAQAILGHPFSITSVAGTTGQTTDQFLARLGTDILALSPRPHYCMVGSVENDSVSAAQSIANLQSIFDQLIAAGIQPIARTCLPYAGKSVAFRALRGAVNQWTKAYGLQRGFPVFDAFAAVADLSTGDPLATTTRDALVHPCWNGASLIGKQMAAALAPWLRYSVSLPEANDDGGNLIANGLMVGGTTTPTSWSYFTNGVAPTRTKVARTDLIGGEWMQFAFGASMSATACQIYQNISTGFVVGDRIVFKCEFQTDADTVGSYDFQPTVGFTNGSPFTPCTDAIWSSGNGDVAPTATLDLYPRSGVMVSPVITIPPGTTALQPLIGFGTHVKGTWRIGRCEIRKVA